MFNKNKYYLRLTHFKKLKNSFCHKRANLKHAEFVLQNDIDDIHGFRMSWYRKFTALSKIQRQKNNDICNQHDQRTRITRSNLTPPATS